MCIAQMACAAGGVWDWPALLQKLYSGMTNADASCCKCMLMLCDELHYSHTFHLLPAIAPTVFSIIANPHVRMSTLRAHAEPTVPRFVFSSLV
jgi:hypothetical protein